MEMGCAAVLVNTAIAVADNPVAYAKAFSEAVAAGRLAIGLAFRRFLSRRGRPRR